MSAQADLVTYLDTVVTETAGTDLFEGPMPELPDNCIAVYQYEAGEAADRVMGASLADNAAFWPVYCQVMVRNASQATAWARAKACFGYLDNYAGDIGSITYHLVEALGEPTLLGQDGNLRWRVVFNVRCDKERD